MRLLLRWSPPALIAGCAAMLALIYFERRHSLPRIGSSELNAFTTVFLGVIFEALPFMLLGVVVSAILQVFVSEQMIRKLAPNNPLLGSLFGGLLGLLFPLCECGMIPIVRRLISKGMPAYVGIVYILAGPIVNPVVFASTYTAFRGQPEIVYERMALGFLVAFLMGLLLHRMLRANPLKEQLAPHAHEHRRKPAPSLGARLMSTMGHAAEEFFDMGKYLIFGSLLTAVIQTSVDRSHIEAIAASPWLAHVFMMGFAYLLSLCSTSDAFIAASFSNMFTTGPLLAFLVFGPMIDLKNTLMLFSVFRARIVLIVIAFTAVLVYASTWLTEALLG